LIESFLAIVRRLKLIIQLSIEIHYPRRFFQREIWDGSITGRGRQTDLASSHIRLGDASLILRVEQLANSAKFQLYLIILEHQALEVVILRIRSSFRLFNLCLLLGNLGKLQCLVIYLSFSFGNILSQLGDVGIFGISHLLVPFGSLQVLSLEILVDSGFVAQLRLYMFLKCSRTGALLVAWTHRIEAWRLLQWQGK
jgi:hypothetical protein